MNDSYGKPGLLTAEHRLRMCELAADAAPNVMVDRCAAVSPSWVCRCLLYSGVHEPTQVCVPRV